MDKNDRKQVRNNDQQKARSIKKLVKTMVTTTDPSILNSYRTLIRSNVSIFRRAYLAGYLYKLLEDSGIIASSKLNKQDTQKYDGKKDALAKQRRENGASSRVGKLADDTSCIYMNIGKVHGAQGEEIVNELVDSNLISREMVRQIKTFDLYSFLYVDSTKAQVIIDALNGTTRNNKKLTVSYSKRGN